MIALLAFPSSERFKSKDGDVLVFFDMLVAVRVFRRLSTFSFGLMSAGSLCDGAAVGRAQRRPRSHQQ